MTPTPTSSKRQVAEAVERLQKLVAPTSQLNCNDCYPAIRTVLAALKSAKEDSAHYIKTFGHTHINAQDGTDRCGHCGLDLRDAIHFRKPTP